MKLIIAGGRDYHLANDDYEFLDSLKGVMEVVSGGALGADLDGEIWAMSRDIPVKRFVPDWKMHGKAAGPIRNRLMAEYADAVVLFPGGRGTDSMAREADRCDLVVYDRRV